MESGSTIEFISCAVAAERIEAKEAVVIDVRSLDEFSYGMCGCLTPWHLIDDQHC
jgi:hypothetical protein